MQRIERELPGRFVLRKNDLTGLNRSQSEGRYMRDPNPALSKPAAIITESSHNEPTQGPSLARSAQG